ncbi:MAG: asparagine synthase (glutamine-hydrolyzing) [Gammaproteobacteria bacterium]|nr:asparagine synthase (glutamine-hydrolyzing) [Gammaproteobacteria bacterium]
MCGIVGALAFPGSTFKITEPYITTMRDTMIHRGPDGADTWIDERAQIGLGHRRLSILDLSDAATQPMSTTDQRYWITFNGEIYNHQAIRDELISLGHTTWKTDHSDTEVILYAFAEFGIDCLHKLRGMFAFALWDAQEQELWLARDRIGIKPLYYSIHHQRIVFASEIKALLADPAQERAVNEDAFFHYLSFLTTPAPQTLFAGIHKLPASTWLKISGKTGQSEEHRYWDIAEHAKSLGHLSEDEMVEGVLDELRTSVNLRQISDVPVGVFLSGGIDSSVNAALFSEHSDTTLHTFSVGYDKEYGTYQNELHYAKEMATSISAQYHERLLTERDLLDFLPEMIRLQDEPIADPVCFPVYFVSKLARDNGAIVCQVGEGADELFWGYSSWKIKLYLQRCSNIPGLKWLKRLGLKTYQFMNKKYPLQYEILRRAAADLPIFWGGAEAFTEEQKSRLLSPRLRKRFENHTSWEAIKPIWDRFHRSACDKSDLNWMSYLDLNFRLPELLLMRVDKMSMGVSLEGRVPFLDHKFVEYAFGIPEKLKTKQGQLKYVLKKAVHGLIPENLIHRKKQGFGVPIREWLLDNLGARAREELQTFCAETDFLEYSEIERLMDTNQGAKVWYILNFALWWKEYIQPQTLVTTHKKETVTSHDAVIA